MPKEAKNFINLIDKLGQAGDKAASAQAAAALGDPLIALQDIQASMAAWKASGADQLFANDESYVTYCQSGIRALVVLLVECNLRAVQLLNNQLQDGKTPPMKELANIVGELSRQLSALKKLDETTDTPSPQDLDAEVKRLENELGFAKTA